MTLSSPNVISNNYLSFNNSNNQTNSGVNNNNSNNYGTVKRIQTQNLLMNKETTGTINIYLEVMYIMIWNKEETLNTFPEKNIILIFELNDNPQLQIKIPFEPKEESKSFIKLIPLIKKSDLLNKSYKSLLQISNYDIDKSRPIKLKVSLINYYKDKTHVMSEESLYFNVEEEFIHNKFQLYQNMHPLIDGKKIANILFNIVYDNFSCEYTKKNRNYIDFPKVDKISSFKDKTDLVFLYNNKQSYLISKPVLQCFNSINDINECKKLYLKI